MATTNNLGITLVDQSQAQKEVTINQAFSVLDAVVGKSVVDRSLSAPPALPATSALYIVAASPTGAWAGKATYLAYFDQIWRFIAPQSGMRVWVQNESLDYRFNGTAWVAASSGGAWGSITGTLASQTDLQTALNGKAAIAGQAFTGAISATNLSGTNTGDQTITLTGDVTGSGTGSFVTTVSNAAVTGKALTGFVSGAGTIAATDTILQAIQKLNGNDALKAPLASPTFTGTVSGITAAMVGAPSGSGTSTGTNTGDQTSVTGNAGTATTLQTARNINGVSFNGSADITVPAAAGTLTGATLAAGVTTSSLTSVGTLASLNVSGTVSNGGETITSSSANALVVGPAGATNPVFQVDASTASSATGIAVKSAAAGAGVTMSALSSALNENLKIIPKGTGNLTLQATGTATLNAGSSIFCSGGQVALANAYRGYTNITGLVYTSPGGDTMTAATEALTIDLNMSATMTHATGNYATQRDMLVRGSTHAAVAASTITDAMTLQVDGAPIAGTNATQTNAHSLHSPGRNVGAGTTNSYGLSITANTGATNNYIASLKGSAGEVLRLRTDGQVAFLATNTAAGTNGAQTINKPSGTVNFAAAATSLVVTNSLCTTNSIVFAVVRTNDSTAVIKNVVPAAGSFTITLSAAATAATSVGFFIIN